jgi:hypothetical protein
MRVETKEITWYTLAELKEVSHNGYEKALDNLRLGLWDGGAWLENIADSIAYAFGKAVGDASVDRFGEGDYPGVAGVELKSWAVQDRAAHVGFAGTLTEESAPGLPWHTYLEQVDLRAGRSYTEVIIRDSEDAPYLGWKGIPAEGNEEHSALIDARETMKDAVDAALEEALAAGEQQAEAQETEEALLELAEANEWEFDQHGVMA